MSRRVYNLPVKSPEPDQSARNHIRNTTAPIDDIKRFIRKSQQK